MQVQDELERYRADALHFEAHRQELLEEYPERWIAVYGRQVVGTARRLPRLLEKLDRKGLPRGRVFVEHLYSKEDLLILPSE